MTGTVPFMGATGWSMVPPGRRREITCGLGGGGGGGGGYVETRTGRLPIRRTTMSNSWPVVTVWGMSTVKRPAYHSPVPCGMGT